MNMIFQYFTGMQGIGKYKSNEDRVNISKSKFFALREDVISYISYLRVAPS